MEIKIKLTVDEATALVCAAPAACGYWAGPFYRNGASLTLTDVDSQEDYTVNRTSLGKGLALALRNSACVANQFARWKGSDVEKLGGLDRDAVDIVIQHAAFGEVRYG